MLTNRCNLNCIYCYESNKSNSEMTKDLAYKILDYEMHIKDGYDCIEFNLFGGEPFLCFDLIKNIHSYLSNHEYEKQWKIGLITNGTILENGIREWLTYNKDKITVTLSIDGTKKMQDQNRNNSFDLIDLDFFINTFNKPYAKMTISEYTVDYLCEGILFLQKKGFYVNAGIAYGILATDNFLNKLSRQLDQFYNKMKSEKYKDTSSLLRFPYETIYMSKGKYFRTCDAGKVAKAYDTDGIKYPCYMFLPISLSDKQLENIDTIEFPEVIVDEKKILKKCRNCPIYTVCQNCYCNNYKTTGNIYDIDESVCKISKVMAKKKAEYFAWLWENKKMDITEREEKMLVDSLIQVLKL